MLPATSGEQSWFSAKARWIVFRSGTSKGSLGLEIRESLESFVQADESASAVEKKK